jgi:hypothetical protein
MGLLILRIGVRGFEFGGMCVWEIFMCPFSYCLIDELLNSLALLIRNFYIQLSN